MKCGYKIKRHDKNSINKWVVFISLNGKTRVFYDPDKIQAKKIAKSIMREMVSS